MKHIFVRPVRQNDAEQFGKWSTTTKDNLFDPKVITYPSTAVVAAFNEDKVILYCPIQQPFFMESLATNPEATELEVAAALKEVVQFTVSQAYGKGVGEIYVLCGEDSLPKLALNHVFEELPYRLIRLKISDLEKK